VESGDLIQRHSGARAPRENPESRERREIPGSSLRGAPEMTEPVLTPDARGRIARAMINAVTSLIMRRRRVFAALAVVGV